MLQEVSDRLDSDGLLVCLRANGKEMHAGVSGWDAPEGTAIVPYWMMQELRTDTFEEIEVTSMVCPYADFIQVTSIDSASYEESEVRDHLEQVLSEFSVVWTGLVIDLFHQGRFRISALSWKDHPLSLAKIVNVDLKLEVRMSEEAKAAAAEAEAAFARELSSACEISKKEEEQRESAEAEEQAAQLSRQQEEARAARLRRFGQGPGVP
ncbi:MAG: ubiquitin fusion degradation UFD1 family protein [Sulfobacillus sp.]